LKSAFNKIGFKPYVHAYGNMTGVVSENKTDSGLPYAPVQRRTRAPNP